MTAPDLKPTFYFDRYVNGVKMAEHVCVERASSLSAAMVVASKIASRGPNGEAPVLVYRPTPLPDGASGLALTLQAECERLHGDVDALVEAAQGMSTPIKNVDFETRLEQHGRLFAAIAAAKGAK